MLARAALRQLSIDALLAANTLAAKNVFVHDWPTNIKQTPIAILVNHETDHKVSNGKTVPNFTSTPAIKFEARIEATSVTKVREQLDILLSQMEVAIFTNYALNKLLQQFAYVTTESSITSDSDYHVGQAVMTIGMEIFELFQIDPNAPEIVPLQQVAINVDLVNRFDATGTYVNPPFPNSVTPAPRTEGPDGRNEGYLLIDNLED